MTARPVATTAVAFLVAALGASARAGSVLGVPLATGDQVTADIDSGADIDPYVARLGTGSVVTLDVRLPKGSLFLPRIRAYRPDGSELAVEPFVVGEGTSKVTLALPPLNETGDWVFSVGSRLGTTGSYTVSLREVRPLKSSAKGAGIVAGSHIDRVIAAGDGDLLTFVAKVTNGPAIGNVELLDPSGEPIAAFAAAVSRKGPAVSVKKFALGSGYGNYTLRLHNPGDTATSLDLKTQLKVVRVKKRKIALGAEPRPSSMSPQTGRDGATVTIGGVHFVEGARVLFGDVDAADVVVTPTQITCKAPPGDDSDAGNLVTVCVVNPDFQLGAVASKFSFLGIPAPATMSPHLSPLAGGQTITVSGSNFRAGAAVEVDGLPATSVTVLDATTLTFVTPAHPAGTVTVVVTDEFGRDSAAIPGLRYADPPVLLAASPPTVPSFGLRTVTLTGQNFYAGTQVSVGGVQATGVHVVNDGTLEFISPAGTEGPVTVQVTDVLGRSDSHSGILSRTRSLVNATATAVPAPPAGTDFFLATIGVGDIDGDARPDLLIASPTLRAGGPLGTLPGSRLLRNDGTGNFTDITATNHAGFSGSGGDFGQAHAVTLTDFTKDGRADGLLAMKEVLASSSTQFAYPGGYTGTYVGDVPTLTSARFLLNSGLGVLSNATSTRMPNPLSTPAHGIGNRFQATTVLVGELDNDNDVDMVLINSAVVHRGTISSVRKTTTKVKYYYYYYRYYPDKAYVYQTSTTAAATRVLRNNGSGTFTFTWGSLPSPVYSPGGNLVEDFRADGAAVGDVNGDGFADIVLVSALARQINDASGSYFAPALRVLRGSAGANFTRSPSSIPPAYDVANPGSGDHWQGRSVALADLTGDGRPEIILGRENVTYWVGEGGDRLLPSIRIFRNNGSGTFAEDTESFLAPELFRTGSASTIISVSDIATGDVDADGRVDLLLTGRVHEVPPAGNTGFGAKGILPAGPRAAGRLLRRTASGTLVDATADWLPVGANGDWLQSDVCRLVDLNGDGRLDAIFGADRNPSTTGQTTSPNRPLRILKSQ